MKRNYYLALVAVLIATFSYGQDRGVLTGGFQSDIQFYTDDELIGAISPEEKMASNNYMKLDYTLGSFSAGIRYEAYLPPLLGYPPEYEGNGIANRFISYSNDFLSVTAGNFYEQFGSGLILRTYEERLLGIDNSIDGIRINLRPISGFEITGVYGKQRSYFELGEGIVRGLDTKIGINDLLALKMKTKFDVGFSMVSKYQNYTGPDETIPEIVNAYSGRVSVKRESVYLDVEYVEKEVDPTSANNYSYKRGRALLANVGYSIKGLGLTINLRRLENMDFRSERDATLTSLWINYLPAETKQHGYALANIYPYATQAFGEIGGQFTLSYLFARNSSLGGKYGTSIEVNFSHYNTLKNKVNPLLVLDDPFNTEFFTLGDTTLYSDFNVEVKKKINKNVKLSFMYIAQEYNKQQVEGGGISENVRTNIGAIEFQYKLQNRKSIRAELQHLWTKQDKKNWAAGLIEFNLLPSWSFYVFDQYNYGGEDQVHYYQGGLSYTKSSTRIALGYGRQRGGLLCVGGVCRQVPAASGLNVSISTSF